MCNYTQFYKNDIKTRGLLVLSSSGMKMHNTMNTVIQSVSNTFANLYLSSTVGIENNHIPLK